MGWQRDRFYQEALVRKLLLIFLLTAFFLAACSGLPLLTKEPTKTPARATYTPHPPRPTPSAAEREISDPAKIIEVVAGNQSTITVRTYLPTEYHWGVDEFMDSNIVQYVWKHHLLDEPDNPNSPGRDV